MQNQRAMVKVILKLNSNNMKGHIAVGSYGPVISIWYPEKKMLVYAWRAKGAIYDLIQLDNGMEEILLVFIAKTMMKTNIYHLKI